MTDMNYDIPIEVASGIHWIGFADDNAGLHCNPYLIVDGDEAVLIDGGSRDDFSTVMMKILRTGVDPNKISHLIYQHYDPDLCGSIPHFEELIENPELKIISHRENNIFIKYYSSKRPKMCIEEMDYSFKFKSGRELIFVKTPYAHSPGSFMTFDTKTKTLFSSDVFGSYDRIWELFLEVNEQCLKCKRLEKVCHRNQLPCSIKGIVNFHKRVMTSNKAVAYALNQIEKTNPNIVAPQHGSIVIGQRWIDGIINHLREQEPYGIDLVLGGQEND